MSNENFEVIFAGQLVAGAELEQVKAKVAVIFKTDVTKIAHLFSGTSVVIKKGIDQQMAQKYQSAMKSAGAVCEIRDSGQPIAAAPKPAAPVATKQAAAPPAVKRQIASHAPPAPQTTPLNVTGNSIVDIQASLAPVGSDMNQAKQEVAVVIPDISGLTMAPPGTELPAQKKAPPPPVPDISGLSILKD